MHDPRDPGHFLRQRENSAVLLALLLAMFAASAVFLMWRSAPGHGSLITQLPITHLPITHLPITQPDEESYVGAPD